MRPCKFVSQQYRALPDCMDVHGCAVWSGSILVAKANHFQLQWGKAYKKTNLIPAFQSSFFLNKNTFNYCIM